METLKKHIFEFDIITPNRSSTNDSMEVEITTGKDEKIEQKTVSKEIALQLKKALRVFPPRKILRRENKKKVDCQLMRVVLRDLKIDFHDLRISKLNLSNSIRLNGKTSKIKIVPKNKNIASKIFSFFI